MKDMEENQGNVYREIFAAAYALKFQQWLQSTKDTKAAAKHAYMFAYLAAEEYLQIKTTEDAARKPAETRRTTMKSATKKPWDRDYLDVYVRVTIARSTIEDAMNRLASLETRYHLKHLFRRRFTDALEKIDVCLDRLSPIVGPETYEVPTPPPNASRKP